MSHTIYQAGPLFTQAEKDFHRKLSAALKAAGHEAVWPGDLLADSRIAAAGSNAVPLIFTTCRQAIDNCTCLVALLDGSQVDDGTAWEIGYAHARQLPIYGLRTDTRMAGETGHNHLNSMIEGCLWGLADSIEGLVKAIHDAVEPDEGADEASRRGW